MYPTLQPVTIAPRYSRVVGNAPTVGSYGDFEIVVLDTVLRYRSKVLQDYYAVFATCCEDGWTGEMFESWLKTYNVILSLPREVQDPEVRLDPDGEFTLEWFVEPRKTFTLSVGPDGLLSYAGLFGEETIADKTYFGDSLPDVILDAIGRVFEEVE